MDAARLKNVLFELNIHFRVAALLPILLSTRDVDKLELLGEDVSRTLALIRLQTELAVNILTNESAPNKEESEESLSSSNHSQDSELSEAGQSRVSVEVKQASQAERLQYRLSLAATSKLFSFKETFATLCMTFRSTYDYELLLKAEKLFRVELEDAKTLPVVQTLCGMRSVWSMSYKHLC